MKNISFLLLLLLVVIYSNFILSVYALDSFPSETGLSCNSSIILTTLTEFGSSLSINLLLEINPYSNNYIDCSTSSIDSNYNIKWFSYTPVLDGDYYFTSESFLYTPKVFIFTSCNVLSSSCLTSSEMNVENYFPYTGPSELIYTMYSGITYKILIAARSENQNIGLGLLYELLIPPTNQFSSINNNFTNIVNNITTSSSSISTQKTIIRPQGSCLLRCGEVINPNPNQCNCSPDCNHAVDENCCEDICEYCSNTNIICKSAISGEYIVNCQGRCNDQYTTGGCLCNPSLVYGNTKNSANQLCLDYQSTCSEYFVNANSNYTSCRSRCGLEDTFYGNSFQDGRYACHCTDVQTSSNEACHDINEYCNNESMKPKVQPVESCQGYCGVTPPGNICSCESNCLQTGNCCRDYCSLCVTGYNCNSNSSIHFPPTVYEKHKYFTLALSPSCSSSDYYQQYQTWLCPSCSYYPGYTFQGGNTISSEYEIFIHYNSQNGETLFTIFSTKYHNVVQLFEGCDPLIEEELVVYNQIQGSNVITISYVNNYYKKAMEIKENLLSIIQGFQNYFNTNPTLYFTLIGHGDAGAIASIIYNDIVMKDTIEQYNRIFINQPIVTRPYSRYFIDTENYVTFQGLTTGSGNIIINYQPEFSNILGQHYNGISIFNQEYRIFNYVNSFDIFSNLPYSNGGDRSLIHSYQSYYPIVEGGVTTVPCNNFGTICTNNSNLIQIRNGIIASDLLEGTSYVGFNQLQYTNDISGLSFKSYVENNWYNVYTQVVTKGIKSFISIDWMEKYYKILYGTIYLPSLYRNNGSVYGFVYENMKSIIQIFYDYKEHYYFFGLEREDICRTTIVNNEKPIIEKESEEEYYFILFQEFLLKNREEIIRIQKNIEDNNNRHNQHHQQQQLQQEQYSDNDNNFFSVPTSPPPPTTTIDNDHHYYYVTNDLQSDLSSESLLNGIPTSNTTYIDGNNYISMDKNQFCTTFVGSLNTLSSMSESSVPIHIYEKPTLKQFDKYFNLMSIGFAPFNEIQNFNCSICTYYNSIGFTLYHWENYFYYDLIWLINNFTKEIVIIMSVDNYPQSIYNTDCNEKIQNNTFTLQSPPIDINICWGSTVNYYNVDWLLTEESLIMFDQSKFTSAYLLNDTTAQLMRNIQYKDYYYSFVGFGGSAAPLSILYSWGIYNYNIGKDTIYHCPQDYIQLILFSPQGNFIVEEVSQFDNSQFSTQIKVFMNPCDLLPTDENNPYIWNNRQEINNYMHSYYVNSTDLQIIDFQQFTEEERYCQLSNEDPQLHHYTVYPSHFQIGNKYSIYGYLRNAQSLDIFSEIIYDEVPFNNTEDLCILLNDYPTSNSDLSPTPIYITQPPLNNQQLKYYKVNLLSYSSYAQANEKDHPWFKEDNLKKYIIIEKLYKHNWVVSVYYSLTYNEVIISMMARNDTELYRVEKNCDIQLNQIIRCDTHCQKEGINLTIFNNYNQTDKIEYYNLLNQIMNSYYRDRRSIVTFTGIGLGAGIHKAMLLDFITNNSTLFGIPQGSCIQDYGNIDRLQSLFYSSTKNFYYTTTFFNNNITLNSFMTTVYMIDDANFIAAYKYEVSSNQFSIPTTLSPLWVYYENQNLPSLRNPNENQLTTVNRFYRTYYNLPSPYYNQSNWEYIPLPPNDEIIYINPYFINENIYQSFVFNNDEACAIVTIPINLIDEIQTPPTLIQNELYSYLSMLAYCPIQQLEDNTCVNLRQSISPEIYSSYELFGYSEYEDIRVLYYISHIYRNIVYIFGASSTDYDITNNECSSNILNDFENAPYDISTNCNNSTIGLIYYKTISYIKYINWKASASFTSVLLNNRILYEGYNTVFTGNSLGASIAHIAYVDKQISNLMNRDTCEIDSTVQLIIFGEQPSVLIEPLTISNPPNPPIIRFSKLISIINQCDPVPYLYPNSTGFIYWPSLPYQGKTYIVNEQLNLTLFSYQYNPYINEYSSCPIENEYSIQLFNRKYFNSRTFIGSYINTTLSGDNLFNLSDQESYFTNKEWFQGYGSRGSLISFCNSIIPSTSDTVPLLYTGPTKYQLEKYYKLIVASYYPYHPINESYVPPYISSSSIVSMFNDPQIQGFINNTESDSKIDDLFKVTYFTNYQLKEFVITIIPSNTSSTYKDYSCVWPIGPNNLYSYSIFGNYFLAPNNNDGVYLGKYGILGSATYRTRIYQETILDSKIIGNGTIGNGNKSEWTLTIIGKDMGNSAILEYLFDYYYDNINSELIGGILRYKVSNSGYKTLQTLGFGDIVDKCRYQEDFNPDISFAASKNRIGKNIFTTVSLYNDRLNIMDSIFKSGDATTGTNVPHRCIRKLWNICDEAVTLDKFHMSLRYDNFGNRILGGNSYACTRYPYYVLPDEETIVYNSIKRDKCEEDTIKRDYFGIPNPFYKYSIFGCNYNGTSSQCSYYTDQNSDIQFNNPNYNICAA